MHGRMPLPKEVTFVTFDVYGTLINWETSVYDAFDNGRRGGPYRPWTPRCAAVGAGGSLVR